jgi:regulator of replication initiation timing
MDKPVDVQLLTERILELQREVRGLEQDIECVLEENSRLKRSRKEDIFNAVQKSERPLVEENKRLQESHDAMYKMLIGAVAKIADWRNEIQ